MTITSINKVISMFLTGGLTLCFAILWWWKEALAFLGCHLEPEQPWALLSVAAIILAGVLGMMVDGAAEIIVRKKIREHGRLDKSWLFTFLLRENMHSMMKISRAWFESASKNHWIQRFGPKDHENLGRQDFLLAAGIFHKNASAHEYDSAISHYGTFYLASNYAAIFLPATIVAILRLLSGGFSIGLLLGVFAFAAMSYLSLSVAADRYIYTFHVSFRFAALWLTETQRRGPENCEPHHDSAGGAI